MRLRARTCALMAAVLVLSPPAPGWADLFHERFESFRDAGYDPLTVPVDWFRPIEPVPGAGPEPLLERPVAPAARTVSATALTAAAAYAASQDSMALLVWHAGHLQLERYWNGADRNSRFNPQSMSKTVLAMMVGIAIRDGHLESEDLPVSRWLPEWADDARGAITLKQLLQMSAGLAQITDSYEVRLDNPGVIQHFGTDFAGPMLGLPLVTLPGASWDYNNNQSNLLGLVLTRATGRRYADYLSTALWQPLGLSDAALYLDRPGGLPMFSCCILSRPVDWLKLGILVLHGGAWDGKQVLPAGWVEKMLTGSPANAGYGYQIWLGDYAVSAVRPEPTYPNQPWSSESFLDKGTMVFRGYGYQRVWLLPSRCLVVVRAGQSWPADWDNAAIPNTIFRGTPEGSCETARRAGGG